MMNTKKEKLSVDCVRVRRHRNYYRRRNENHHRYFRKNAIHIVGMNLPLAIRFSVFRTGATDKKVVDSDVNRIVVVHCAGAHFVTVRNGVHHCCGFRSAVDYHGADHCVDWYFSGFRVAAHFLGKYWKVHPGAGRSVDFHYVV